jgi:hypothetical protein
MKKVHKKTCQSNIQKTDVLFKFYRYQYEALEAAKDSYFQEMELLDIFYQIEDETTKHIAILYSILNEDQF